MGGSFSNLGEQLTILGMPTLSEPSFYKLQQQVLPAFHKVSDDAVSAARAAFISHAQSLPDKTGTMTIDGSWSHPRHASQHAFLVLSAYPLPGYPTPPVIAAALLETGRERTIATAAGQPRRITITPGNFWGSSQSME